MPKWSWRPRGGVYREEGEEGRGKRFTKLRKPLSSPSPSPPPLFAAHPPIAALGHVNAAAREHDGLQVKLRCHPLRPLGEVRQAEVVQVVRGLKSVGKG